MTVLLPAWLRLVWVAVFAYVTLSHVGHAAVMPGRRRWWHATHILMAIGMAYMFLPMGLKTLPAMWWETLFTVAASAILVWMLAAWLRRRPVDALWFASLLGTGAMVYMFALPGAAVAAVTYALVAYYVAEAAAWAGGWFYEDGERRSSPLPLVVGPRPPTVPARAQVLARRVPAELRTTLAAMAIGMAYMFVAMQVSA